MLDFFVFFLLIIPGEAPFTLSINAPSTVTFGADQLTITCRLSGSSATIIKQIQIDRKSPNQDTYSTIVEVEEPSKTPVFRDEDLGQRATAEGRAGDPAGVYLQLQVPGDRANCNEQGFYKCKIIWSEAGDTKTISSSSVYINFAVPPSSSNPSFTLSPSNTPDTSSSSLTYIKGTTVLLKCTAQVGNPAHPMRFCLKKSSGYQLMNLQANFLVPSSKSSAKSCVMSRTIIASIQVFDAGKVYCDVYNATTNPDCNAHLVTENKVFSVQDFPVCNVSTTINTSLSTKKTSVTQSPEVTSKGVLVQGNPDVLVDMGGVTFLVVGCVLITLSGALFFTSVIICIKAKKIRKEAEMVSIRNTYDRVTFNAIPASTYSSLHNLTTTYHRSLEKQDSDGYVEPKTFT